MASFTSPGQTDQILSSHITQILDAWNGVAGMGVPFQNVTVSSTTLYAADIQNLDTTNSYGLRVRDASGNVLIRAYKNNVILGADPANDTLAINCNISGKVFIGDSVNTDLTVGLTINQSTNDDQILALKSSTDVAHGMTTQAETDTYGLFKKYAGADGGLQVTGLSDATIGLNLTGYGVTDNTTKSVNGTAYVEVSTGKKDGTGLQSPGANTNLFAVSAYGLGRLFILDADGDSHQAVGTAWTTFPDEYDDVALLNQLSAAIGKNTDALRAQFGTFLEEHKKTLEALRIVTFNPDGRHFLNNSRLQLLLVGAVRQLAARVDRQEQMLLAGGGG